MATQYWVGGFFIDLSRNQITQNNQSRTIAPKALAVLTYLAKNQGKVIRQDELLDEVWQDTRVSPNTLQKSIAQLRKALGESGNIYIKTHAKQGYSLECDVRWQDSIASTEEPDDSRMITALQQSSEQPDNTFKRIVGVLVILFLGVTAVLLNNWNSTTQTTPNLMIKEIRELTATDNKEFSGIYSPDGKYIVFHRYSEELCINNIWAKDIQTQQEFQLTKELNSYGKHSFDKDGKQLVFIQSHDCREPIAQKACYKLMKLDFAEALKSPSEPETILECKNSEIKMPSWLNNNDIAFLQRDTSRWKLVSYSIAENKTEDIFTIESGNIFDYDYSPAEDLLMLATLHGDNKAYIKIIRPNGEIISSHPMLYPQEIPQFRLLYPNFSPVKDQFVFSTGKQWFTLSNQGVINKISLPLSEPMSSPLFHPDGNRAIVIQGHYDSDIVQVSLSEFDSEQNNEPTDYKSFAETNIDFSVLERSTLGEDAAIFQPNGNLIAYESGRSGEEQIWLYDGNNSHQLSNFAMDTYIDGMRWAADGNSLLAVVHGEISQTFLDGTVKLLPFNNPVSQLFSWDSNRQVALALIRVEGLMKFAELDLQNLTTKILKDKTVSWAQYSNDGGIIYSDHLDNFWRPGPAEDELITKLNGQASIHQFIIEENVIYSVNAKLQLWSYDLKKDELQVLGPLPHSLDFITDIRENELLLSIRIAAKKEVTEVVLTE